MTISIVREDDAPSPDDKILDWWLRTRSGLPADRRRSFDALVILVSWNIWKERNARTFDRRRATTSQLLSAISEEILALFNAGYRALAPLLPLTDQ